MATLKDYIQLHFLVILWGFTAILGLLISLPPIELVFYRILFSILGLALLLFFKKQSIRLPLFSLLSVVGVGFIVSIHWITFFLSARISNASVCLAGLATSSFWTSFIEPLLNKRKISFWEVALGLFVALGLLIIFRFELKHFFGLILGVFSALAQAIFSTLNGKFTHYIKSELITFYEMTGAFIFTLIFLPIYAFYFADGTLYLQLSLTDIIYIGILALVCTVYAYAKAVELMKRISAFALNLTINLEPLYGMFLAWLFFKEQMTPGFYLGASIILICVISYPVAKLIRRRMTN